MLFESTIRRELARGFGAALGVMLTVVVTRLTGRTRGQASRGEVDAVVDVYRGRIPGVIMAWKLVGPGPDRQSPAAASASRA